MRLVLLSGGLDSSVALAVALESGSVGVGLFFDYGQRAVAREEASARAVAQRFGVPFRLETIPLLARLGGALTHRAPVPVLQPGDLGNLRVLQETAAVVWVPNRNGLFINLAAAIADDAGGGQIIVGFNREEAVTFPDNSQAFVEATNAALSFSSRSQVQVVAPLADLDKEEIVRRGLELGVPLESVWSCYEGERAMCGQCESCLRLKRAYAAVGRPELWTGR